MRPSAERPTDDDFRQQIDRYAELESIDNRERWVALGSIERFLLKLRRRQLTSELEAWDRRWVGNDEDVEGHRREA